VNRDELLEECFGRSDFPAPLRVFEEVDLDTGAVLSHVDAYMRRVVVRQPRAIPGTIHEAATTLTVLGIAQVCTDPDHRGRGLARGLVRRAHEEMSARQSVKFAALYSDYLPLYEPLGYFHPEDAPPGFLVCRLGEDEWPAGRVIPQGQW
jgi:GNAT superfamily N-acetyltransferase